MAKRIYHQADFLYEPAQILFTNAQYYVYFHLNSDEQVRLETSYLIKVLNNPNHFARASIKMAVNLQLRIDSHQK